MIKILNERLVDTKKVTNILVTIAIIIGAFVVPTFLAKVIPLGKHQQLIIGTIVNMSLILTALYTKGSMKTIAIATLPSISTILGGLLFRGMTLYSKKVQYPISTVIAVLVKVAIIYLGFMIMVNAMIVPDMVKQTLNTSMGITQLITAISGSILASLIIIYTKIRKKTTKEEEKKNAICYIALFGKYCKNYKARGGKCKGN